MIYRCKKCGNHLDKETYDGANPDSEWCKAHPNGTPVSTGPKTTDVVFENRQDRTCDDCQKKEETEGEEKN